MSWEETLSSNPIIRINVGSARQQPQMMKLDFMLQPEVFVGLALSSICDNAVRYQCPAGVATNQWSPKNYPVVSHLRMSKHNL